MTDESCCYAEAERGVREWQAGPVTHTTDNTNGTAISPFNTHLASTLGIMVGVQTIQNSLNKIAPQSFSTRPGGK